MRQTIPCTSPGSPGRGATEAAESGPARKRQPSPGGAARPPTWSRGSAGSAGGSFSTRRTLTSAGARGWRAGRSGSAPRRSSGTTTVREGRAEVVLAGAKPPRSGAGVTRRLPHAARPLLLTGSSLSRRSHCATPGSASWCRHGAQRCARCPSCSGGAAAVQAGRRDSLESELAELMVARFSDPILLDSPSGPPAESPDRLLPSSVALDPPRDRPLRPAAVCCWPWSSRFRTRKTRLTFSVVAGLAFQHTAPPMSAGPSSPSCPRTTKRDDRWRDRGAARVRAGVRRARGR